MAKNEKTTKATQRNMRSRKDGSVTNANHVTLEATRTQQGHIDNDRFRNNIYIRFDEGKKPEMVYGGTGGFNARKHEIKRYKELYGEGLEARNERYIENRHKERCRSIEELYADKKTAPLESLWQVGNSKTDNMTQEEMRRVLTRAWNKTYTEMKKKWGENMIPLTAGLHMDEVVVHLHYRVTLGCKDEYGHFMPNQNKALEAMGFDRPDPSKPRSRYNNALIHFSDTVREMFYQNCEREGLTIDREVTSASHRQKELLELQCEGLQKELEAAKRELEEMTQEAARQAQRALTAQETLERTLGNIQTLDNKIKALEAEKAGLVAQRDEYRTENGELKTENRKLQNRNDDLERQIIQKESEIRNINREIQSEIIKKDQAIADRKAAVDALAEIEKHQEEVYRASASRLVRKYETIEARKEKKNLRGQVVQEARPECIVVAKEDLERTIEQAKYNINTHYYTSRIKELDKQLQTNEIYAAQRQKISDLELQLNQKDMDLTKAQRTIIKKDNELNHAIDFIKRHGWGGEYERECQMLSQSQSHSHHFRR